MRRRMAATEAKKMKLYNGNCLDIMMDLPSGSVDMILCDLPYGVTNCKWDSVLPFDLLWDQYNRILKPDGAAVLTAVLTAVQPFTTSLIHSNREHFRYCWYWKKNQPTGFPFAKVQPMREIEDIAVFYRRKPTYQPQGLVKLNKPFYRGKRGAGVYDEMRGTPALTEYTNYPMQVLEFKCERGLHPSQKPVQLFEYLIRTYTHPGETVLDNCMGSGTTGVACVNTGRRFIGIELDKGYFEIAKKRINEAQIAAAG